MTSSATRTTDDRRWQLVGRLVFAAMAVFVWTLILFVNDWYLGVPAVMLCLGWAALLAVGWFLWQSGAAAWAEADGTDDEGFEVTTTRRDELTREKKALLKALKDLEFDHQMGKLSVADAESIRQLYRGRAIAIIKQLEALEDVGDSADAQSIRDQIERELAIRLSVVEVEGKGAKRAKEELDKAESET